jgi:flagellar biogenesis protein FliO
MVIDDISIAQIVTAILFIVALIAVQIYITKNKSTLKVKWGQNKRIQVEENTRLGPNENVQILRIDQSEYLYFFSKGNQPVILPLYSKTQESKNSRIDATRKHSTQPKSTSIKRVAPSNSEKISQPDSEIIEAISLAKKKNPKVSFE